ncbi:hypothetical protein ACI76O_11760 [Capnocytophaga cynodegmi]|uniref:hypothetical protein n=1 Tax=Capnocytophaga cynodegmi TaxID=28189 RepID=UPI00385AD7E9
MFNKLKNIFIKKEHTKHCTIYKTKDCYKIVTMSESDIGAYIADGEIFISPVLDNIENLKLKIFQALNNSRLGVKTPEPEQWSIWQKEHLKSLKEKSFKHLYKNCTHCNIELKNKSLTIYPLKETYPKGLELVEEGIIEMEYSPEKELEITEKIIEVLNKSYK